MGGDVTTIGQLKHELTVAELESSSGRESIQDNTIEEEISVSSAAMYQDGFFEYAQNLGMVKECFSHPRPRAAWSSTRAVYEDGEKPTFEKVIAKSRELELFGEIGGAKYFRLFREDSREDAERACTSILENHHRRKARGALGSALRSVLESLSGREIGTSRAIQELQATIDGLQESGAVSAYAFSLHDALRGCAEIVKHGTEPATSTGFYDIDSTLGGGFRGGELHVIAGRTSMGKSAFALSMINHIAERMRKRVALLTLEMPAQQIIQRLIVQNAKIPIGKLRWDKTRAYNAPSHEDKEKIGNAMRSLMDCPVEVIDRQCHRFEDICNHIRRLAAADCKVVFIDGLWLIRGDGKEDLRIELKRMTGIFKEMSIRYDMTIIAVHQINRGVEKQTDQRPSVSDLRDSSIEDDCDSVMALYRPEYYLKGNTPEDMRGAGECLILKNRNGPTGKVHLKFEGEFMQWQNLTTTTATRVASHGKEKAYVE